MSHGGRGRRFRKELKKCHLNCPDDSPWGSASVCQYDLNGCYWQIFLLWFTKWIKFATYFQNWGQFYEIIKLELMPSFYIIQQKKNGKFTCKKAARKKFMKLTLDLSSLWSLLTGGRRSKVNLCTVCVKDCGLHS
jgi:hypothetical protein